MPKITYITQAGETHILEGKVGETAMELAVRNSVTGIDADCGGACACATCHVYISDGFHDIIGKPNDEEQAMLEFTEEVQDNSRLSCQIKLTDAMDGAVLNVVLD